MGHYNAQKITGVHFVKMICARDQFVFMTMTISKNPTVSIAMGTDNAHLESANVRRPRELLIPEMIAVFMTAKIVAQTQIIQSSPIVFNTDQKISAAV